MSELGFYTLCSGLMSGMCSLHRSFSRHAAVFCTLTPEEIVEFSPIRHLDRIACRSPSFQAETRTSQEFKHESNVFAEALEGMGRLASRTVAFDANHFAGTRTPDHPDTEVAGSVLIDGDMTQTRLRQRALFANEDIARTESCGRTGIGCFAYPSIQPREARRAAHSHSPARSRRSRTGCGSRDRGDQDVDRFVD